MREFVAITLEGDPYYTRLSLKDIGGLICKELLRTMLGSVTNVRDMLRISTNLEGP